MTETKKTDGLKIALPNGSLEEGTLRLFEDAGLRGRKSSRKHSAPVDGQLISEARFMRPQHIPDLVASGTYHLGICGSDCIKESGAEVATLAKLLYGRGTSNGCTKVVLVTSEDNPVQGVAEVPPGSLILSEYPNITQQPFAKLGVPVEIRFSYGSTEAHIPTDYQYGVCLTDTGESLEANSLKILAVFFESSTVLIANVSALRGEKAESIKTVECLLTGVLSARGNVLLKMNVPAEKKEAVLAVLPALKTPTVALLADGSSFALETVVPRSDANRIIVEVAKAGAQSILQLPITKVIQNW